jgi:hypothetical protein
MFTSVWVFSPWPMEKLKTVAGGLQLRAPYFLSKYARSFGNTGDCSDGRSMPLLSWKPMRLPSSMIASRPRRCPSW